MHGSCSPGRRRPAVVGPVVGARPLPAAACLALPRLLALLRPLRLQLLAALLGHAISFFSSPKCGAMRSISSMLCWRKRSAWLRALWRSQPISSSTLRPLISAESSVSRSISSTPAWRSR